MDEFRPLVNLALITGLALLGGLVAQRLGVSQAQVARIEKQGYESYTLTTLHRYLNALGEGFSLEISVRKPPAGVSSEQVATTA